jgi:hypothetical protein
MADGGRPSSTGMFLPVLDGLRTQLCALASPP